MGDLYVGASVCSRNGCIFYGQFTFNINKQQEPRV